MVLALTACAAAPPAADTAGRRAGARSEVASKLLDGEDGVPAGKLPEVTSFEAGVRAGDDAWRRRELDLAVFLYVQALSFNDRDGETLAKIGSIHEVRGNAAQARKAFEMAAERSPSDPRILERLGLLCLRLGDHPAAARRLEAARALAADRWQTHEGLGLVALHERDAAAAVAHFDAALALEPGALESLAGRGRAQLLAGNLGAAEADLERALEGGSADWQASVRRDLGTLYARRGRYAEGLALLLRVMPEAQAYNRLGEIAMTRGDYAGAERLLTKAMDASPTYYVDADRNLIVVREHLSAARQAAGMPDSRVQARRVVQGSVVVRERADATSGALGYLQPDDAVMVVDASGDWSQVSFMHRATGTIRQGWVRNRYLVPASP